MGVTPSLEALRLVRILVFGIRVQDMIRRRRACLRVTHAFGVPSKAHRETRIHLGEGKSGEGLRRDHIPNRFRSDGLTTRILPVWNISK